MFADFLVFEACLAMTPKGASKISNYLKVNTLCLGGYAHIIDIAVYWLPAFVIYSNWLSHKGCYYCRKSA
ncbi:hypothetical protein AQUCO_01400119v1 [Aquilegia coerulea]|uniref:Uncharacterized protein n=1 Tax=Aquilegia coerulea TaxID=218851 RepID=A0A2G5DUM4_AQUCA|nr:hypothetical protein AQUCO_01400119v1 [Aquilegia coerulea]